MIFYNTLVKDIEKLDTIYDLAAYCYDYLISLTLGRQVNFIASYIWENTRSKKNNPNLDLMRKMTLDIKKNILEQYNMGLMFEEYRREFSDLIKWYEEQLLDFGEDEVLNHAVLPFFIIKGLELYVEDMEGSLSLKSCPLNENYQEESYVYLNGACELMDGIAVSAGFGSTITPNEIRNQIKKFIFLEKRDIGTYGVPHMVTLNKNKEYLKCLLEKKVIKVAVIPFSCADMLHFPIVEGAKFIVEYKEWHKKYAQKRAIELLRAAIESGANIIVFPEFVCSPDIQKKISDTLMLLSKDSPQKLKDLLLVVAGTGWSDDSNNVAKIYNDKGILLGCNYKYSSFSTGDDREGMMEGLRDPGKETTIIKIPKIGNVQIGICRDISESGFTKDLARIFSPAFLLVPAWSKSIARGFQTQLQSVISQNYTTVVVLCNCCEAFKETNSFREKIGMVLTPHKEKTIIIGKETPICRKESSCLECMEKLCFFSCSFDFNVKKDKKGVTLEKPTQFLEQCLAMI